MVEVNTLKEWVNNWFIMNRHYHPYAKSNNIPIPELYDILERMPTIDAVHVVRCKDCKHRTLNENYNKEKPGSLKAVCELDTGDYFELGRCAEDDEWFCADGERKDDET